jgi:hypothetical protein
VVSGICHVGEFGICYGIDWDGGSWGHQEEGIWVTPDIVNSALALAAELWVQYFRVANRIEISNFSDVGLFAPGGLNGRKDLENGVTFRATNPVFSRPRKFVSEDGVEVNCIYISRCPG